MNNDLAGTPAEEKPKHAGGRPSDYSGEVLQKTKDYYTRCLDTKEGKVNVPYVEELAVILDVSRETIYAWCKEPEKREFSDTIEKIKNLQRLRLMQRTLGRFNAAGAIFQLKANHDMKDRIDITTNDEKLDTGPTVVINTQPKELISER